MSRSIKANKNEKLKTKQFYEKKYTKRLTLLTNSPIAKVRTNSFCAQSSGVPANKQRLKETQVTGIPVAMTLNRDVILDRQTTSLHLLEVSLFTLASVQQIYWGTRTQLLSAKIYFLPHQPGFYFQRFHCCLDQLLFLNIFIHTAQSDN